MEMRDCMCILFSRVGPVLRSVGGVKCQAISKT